MSTHLDCKVILPVISKAFVELAVFLIGDVIRVTGPDRLGLVQFLGVNVLFLDLLLPLVFAVFAVLILIRSHILNLGLVFVLNCCCCYLLLFLTLFKINLLFSLFLNL